ncbi:hypothetical protein [Alloactinosynnema sp. L-07]|uniref:caspase, EACC1-associated type n=1 Tax=Alloactinosynnema sp. L-07 TaxID=1653480 RepID=UPI00065EF65A|nr:tetratricopeptide repeat protein [Alloactinosynnema sp. L-07]CRK57615.1 hypothetical protein [Alloactinosynnema sp. L-07]
MPDAVDGDYSRSRAVLIGNWNYRHLTTVPAAQHSLERMRSLLTGPVCGGWPQDRVMVVADQDRLADLPHDLVLWFQDVVDVALFYYVGHGQYDHDDRLCLALGDSSDHPALRTTTSLTFDAVRHAFRTSKATTKIAVIDCCFAELAADGQLGQTELPRSPGFYLMMASGAFSTAWFEHDPDITRPQTYFTKALVDVIERGIPGQPESLTLGPIFDAVADELARHARPEPRSRASDRASAYRFARNHAATLLPSRVATPVRVGLPPPIADHYQERRAVHHIRRTLTDGGTAILMGAESSAGVVVAGLGGVGKSQVAARYAWSVWPDHGLGVVVWASAMSRDAVITAYAEAARQIQRFGSREQPPDEAAEWFRNWLGRTESRWLVVLDDVQDPADIRELWPPSRARGQVMVTTRRRDSALRAHGRTVIELGVFTQTEAIDYLADALPAVDDQRELGELASELGHLPLALAQATAFITDNPLLTIRGYRDRLADQQRRLSEVVPIRAQLPDQHRDTVAATWSLSIEHANTLPPYGLAEPLLRIASLLDPNGFPLTLLTSDVVRGFLTRITGAEVDTNQVSDGLANLHKLSLITLDPGQPARAIAVHALVQRAVRDTLTGDQRDELARLTADALAQAWSQAGPELHPVLRTCTATAHRSTKPSLWKPNGHSALFMAGNSLGEAGQVAAALVYFEDLRDQATHYLGADHRDTLHARYRAAIWRTLAGDAAGAVVALQGVLADQLRVLGPSYPDTLTTRQFLARSQAIAGDAASAVVALRELLPDCIRVLGSEHPHTLTTRHYLARCLGEAGDPVGAVVAFERVLDDRLRVLGPDHPSTLKTRHNIARWQAVAGDAAGAVVALQELLPDRVRVLGPDHPDTLMTRHHIARWQSEAGDPIKAKNMFDSVLADRLRVLGPDHPDTMNTRHHLAHCQGEAGDIVGAVAAFESLLADRLRVLGPNHPDTIATTSYADRWRARANHADRQ